MAMTLEERTSQKADFDQQLQGTPGLEPVCAIRGEAAPCSEEGRVINEHMAHPQHRQVPVAHGSGRSSGLASMARLTVMNSEVGLPHHIYPAVASVREDAQSGAEFEAALESQQVPFRASDHAGKSRLPQVSRWSSFASPVDLPSSGNAVGTSRSGSAFGYASGNREPADVCEGPRFHKHQVGLEHAAVRRWGGGTQVGSLGADCGDDCVVTTLI